MSEEIEKSEPKPTGPNPVEKSRPRPDQDDAQEPQPSRRAA